MSNHPRKVKVRPSFGVVPPPAAYDASAGGDSSPPEPAPEVEPFVGMAWRVFALEADGTLAAPFVDHYWPGSTVDRVWQTETKTATCIAADHPAPVEECSCGIAGVRSFTSFIDAVTTGHFADSPVPVIEECPVIARVKLAGRSFPSREVNDPPETLRAEQATVVAIHLAPTVTAKTAQAVADRYRNARCFTYEPDRWPALSEAASRVWPTPTAEGADRFLAEVREAGFGTIRRRDLREVALSLGEDAVEAMRGGATPEDLASVLFDTWPKPTFAQARTLVLAAAEHLSPGLILEHGGFQHARPVRVIESMQRLLPPLEVADRNDKTA